MSATDLNSDRETLTHAPRPAAVVIVAAGRGVRAGGGLPKQYRMLRGKPVLAHTVAAFDRHIPMWARS
jgi:2-C-methyl-D-erythritol 4-phosphate cytidylyltransferase